ncbi:hypothetical protein LP420_20000 [Massilia sp. B-10]|nr:hypothetical protein LP420_20000 [Massilia sp. B-10]
MLLAAPGQAQVTAASGAVPPRCRSLQPRLVRTGGRGNLVPRRRRHHVQQRQRGLDQ